MPREGDPSQTFKGARADEILSDFPSRSRAYWAADGLLVKAAPEPAGLRAELYAQAGPMKNRAMTVAEALFPLDSEVQQVLAKVCPGTGYADRADDPADARLRPAPSAQLEGDGRRATRVVPRWKRLVAKKS